MTRESARILLASLAGLGLLAFVLWLALGRSRPETVAGDEVTRPGTESTTVAATTLYFPGPGARLSPETRELPTDDDAERRIQGVVEALLAGPESPELLAPLHQRSSSGSRNSAYGSRQ